MGMYIILRKLGKDAPLEYSPQGFKSEDEAKAFIESDVKDRGLSKQIDWTREKNGDLFLFFEGDTMYQIQHHGESPAPLVRGSESTH